MRGTLQLLRPGMVESMDGQQRPREIYMQVGLS